MHMDFQISHMNENCLTNLKITQRYVEKYWFNKLLYHNK